MNLSSIFTSHMVLQRQKVIRIFGQGVGNIIINFNNITKSLQNSADKWEIEFPEMPAGGPYTMEIVLDGKEFVLYDIMIGDVWLCGGQSNMEQPLLRTESGLEEAGKSYNENIRFFTVPRRVQKDVAQTGWHFFLSQNQDTPWEICNEQSALYFSAIGYYFAKGINHEIGVPCGMINCNWGGTQIEPYIEETICQNTDSIKPIVALHDRMLAEVDNSKYEIEYKEYLKKVKYDSEHIRLDSVEDVKSRGLRAAEMFQYPSTCGAEPYGKYHATRPGILFNSMVSRITPFSLKGVLWYQGESNAHSSCKTYSPHRADYSEKYKALMSCWRDAFKCPDLSFYAVELAPYFTEWGVPLVAWAYLREEQMKAAKLPGSYLVTAQNTDDGLNIHPSNKKPVAERLVKSALKNTYNWNILHESPVYKSVEFKDGRAYVTFDNDDGLYSFYFIPYLEICDDDKIFKRANGEIKDNKLIAWSDEVRNPVAVRYCFQDHFIGTIFNIHGSPAHPFRTDNYNLFGE